MVYLRYAWLVWVNSVVLSFAFICVLCGVLLALNCMVFGGLVLSLVG